MVQLECCTCGCSAEKWQLWWLYCQWRDQKGVVCSEYCFTFSCDFHLLRWYSITCSYCMSDVIYSLGARNWPANGHTYIHAYIHTYIHTHIHTHTHTYIHTHIHTYTHTYIHTYTHTHIHTYIHTYTHTYIYTYIHTYIRVHNPPWARAEVWQVMLLMLWCWAASFFNVRERESSLSWVEGERVGVGCFLVRLYLVSLNYCKDTIL